MSDYTFKNGKRTSKNALYYAEASDSHLIELRKGCTRLLYTSRSRGSIDEQARYANTKRAEICTEIHRRKMAARRAAKEKI